MIDIFAAYLARLGVIERPQPTRAVLNDLIVRHLQTVPFENLDVMAGTPRPLGTRTSLEKIVHDARGGFCYELNEAFRALLEHLGFTVRRIEARVWKASTLRFGAPFDHLALVVTLADDDFLVDVGYGDGPRSPLRLPRDQSTDLSGDYRLAPVSDGMLRLSREFASHAREPASLSHTLAPSSQPLYEMTLGPQSLDAYAAMCRYHQTSPESIFSQGIICTRATSDGRITLSRDRLIRVAAGQRTETPAADLSLLLKTHFGIPPHPNSD